MTNTSTETRSVVVEREMSHPPEKLWRALTQPHLIEEWLMKNDFKPAVGHRFNLRGDWGGVLDCEVLAIEPNKALSYTWNFKHEDAAFNLQSVVTFIANSVAMGLGVPPAWVVYSPLLPLFLLLFTGLYMFVLPYATKWRSG